MGGSAGRAMRPAAMRMRLTFSKGPSLRFIGHLDLARAWERALRRADLPVAWTQGFTPRVRLAFAAPLSLGTVALREFVDVFFTESIAPDEVLSRLGAQLPPGCALTSATTMPVAGPSLASQVRWASYEFAVWRSTSTPAREIGVDLSAGSRWSRRVPDDSSISAPTQNRQVKQSLGSVADIPEPDAPLRMDVETGDSVGFRATRSGEMLTAGPGTADAITESPLRPRSEWLPTEDPDPGPPDWAEVAGQIESFVGATSVVIHRVRDEKAVAVEVRGAVEGIILLGDSDGNNGFEEASARAETRHAPRISLVVRHDVTGAGRPEDVAAALGYEARWIVRRAIGLEGDAYPPLGA